MRGRQQKECIRLRQAVPEDAEMVFKWRNDPFIIARGSSQRTVCWDEHQKWFSETVRGNSRKMFIIQKDDMAIGQIRFDRVDQKTCIVSVYLLEEFTHKGYGRQAIRYGCLEISRVWDVQEIIACVRQDNPVARAAFIKAGFLETGDKKVCPEAHFTLSLSRSGVESTLT